MKIRNGFVSNSSSSSFVLCGIKITTNENDNRDFYDAIDEQFPDYSTHFGSEDGTEEGSVLIGVGTYDSDYSLPTGNYNIEKISEITSEIEQKARELGYTDIKSGVFFGTRLC